VKDAAGGRATYISLDLFPPQLLPLCHDCNRAIDLRCCNHLVKHMLLGESYLGLQLNAMLSWEQTRIHTSRGPFPPPPAHRPSGHSRSERGKEENLLPAKLKVATSCLVVGLVTAHSKAVSEQGLIFNHLFQVHVEAPPS